LDFQADGIVHRRSFFRTVLAQFPIRLAPGGCRKGLTADPGRLLLQNAWDLCRLPDGDHRPWPADRDHSRRIYRTSRLIDEQENNATLQVP
jgi:hypothetical protein